MKALLLKLAALLAAMALWLHVVLSAEYIREVSLPLRFSGLGEQLALSTPALESVRVELRGSGWAFLAPDRGFMRLDLTGAPLGRSTILLAPGQWSAPARSDLKIERVVGPQRVDLDLDARLRRSLPIRLGLQAMAAPECVLIGPPRLYPESLEVSGTRAQVATLTGLQTEERVLSGLCSDTVVALALLAGRTAPSGHASDTVHVLVRAEPLGHKMLAGVPVRLAPPGWNGEWRLEPDTAQLILTGGALVLDSLVPQELDLFVEYSRFGIEGKEALAPTLRSARPLHSWQTEPATFRLTRRTSEKSVAIASSSGNSVRPPSSLPGNPPQ
jgi:hypothetical protein